MTQRNWLESHRSPGAADVRVRGVALAALLAGLPTSRHALARRVYSAMRRRKLSRDLAADLAARACAAFDGGADFASIAAELRIPTNWLTPRAPAGEDGPTVGATSSDAAALELARRRDVADGWHARALRAEPAPVRRGGRP